MNEPSLVDSLRFYRNLAPFYDMAAKTLPSFPSATRVFDILSPHLSEEFSSMVDLGIGTGLSSRPFHDQAYWITGVDGSEDMLGLCRQKGIAQEFVRWDFTRPETLPFDKGTFDVAISTNTFYLLPHETQERMIGEMQRITRKDGIFAFDYEVQMRGQLSMRFNDAGLVDGQRAKITTYACQPTRMADVLKESRIDIVEARIGQVATKWDSNPIFFQTLVCRNS